MKKNKSELFCKEEVENVSNMLENNYYVLSKIKDYREQSLKLNELHSKITDKIPKSLSESFCEYDSLIWDTRGYELSLLYHLGLKKGFEINNL